MSNYHLSLTLEDLYKFLSECFYVPVPFPMQRRKIEEAVQAFFKFLEYPKILSQASL